MKISNQVLKVGLTLGAALMSVGMAHAQWKPAGPITLMVAYAAGGGADTQARLVAEYIEKTKGWQFIPKTVAGKGGLNMLKAMKGQAGDGTVIGMAATEALGYALAADPKSGMKPTDFTPLATTAGFQMGIAAKTSKGWKTFNDVIAAAKAGEKIRFGSMSPKLSDLAYLLGKANGVEFNIVNVAGGKKVMDGLNAGDLDVGWGAGIQSKAVAAGDMVNLASGMTKKLDLSPNAPLMADLGVKFNADGYFMFVAPGNMNPEARKAIAAAIEEAVTASGSKANGLIKKAFGGPTVFTGAKLDAMVSKDYADSQALIKAASQ